MGDCLEGCGSVTLKCRATEEEMQLIFSKKRKVNSELENEHSGHVELATNSVSTVASRTSGCSRHDKRKVTVKKSLRSPDLESASLETENSTSDGRVYSYCSRESTPTSELYGDSEQVFVQLSSKSKKKPTTLPTILHQKTPYSVAAIMPSAVELEEFFAAAEKYEQKRFAEKYNYDIVKDVPLEGEYQWVRLLP